MHYELYVDSLFFMNFIMNLYLLILVDRSVLGAAALWRLLLGAAVGALGFLVPFLGVGPAALRLGAGIGLGTAGMLCITFRIRSLRMFLKLLERLAVYSFGVGGAMLLIIKRLPAARETLTGTLGLLGLGGLVFLMFRRFRYGVDMGDSLCRAMLYQDGEQVEVGALVDSGNSLVEPVSGKPVCVVDRSVFEMLWKGEAGNFRAIPYRSIGKKRGIMQGCLMDGLQLELDGMKLYFNDVYIAVSKEEISGEEGACAESVKMIVNPELLKGNRKGKPLKRQDERKDDSENNVTGKDAVQDDTQGEFVPAQEGGDSLYRRCRGTASASGDGEGESGHQRSWDGV